MIHTNLTNFFLVFKTIEIPGNDDESNKSLNLFIFIRKIKNK